MVREKKPSLPDFMAPQVKDDSGHVEMERISILAIYALGAYVHGALVLSGLFVMAVMNNNKWSALMAIASAGFAWLAQNVMAGGQAPNLGHGVVGLSALCGLVSFGWLALG